MTASWGEGDLLGVTARILSMIAIAFPVLAIGYILTRLVRQVAVAVWRRTSGRPLQRGVAAVTAGAVLAGLAWVWWPDPGTYRPIQPYERGTLVDAVAAARPAPAGLAEGRPGQLQTIWPATTGGEMPTADHPQLAMVLVPRATQDQASGTEAEPGPRTVADSSTGPAAPAWVFPFDRPLAPEEGDNQALAVNTTDGSVVYDVAFALVWVEDDQVLNTNEAYALASCRNCAAVAVGFQVVLVLGQANVVVPQNLSAAVNYNCVQCLTYALATQLVVTLEGPLSDAGMAELTRLWQQIARFGENIEGMPLSELRARLTAYEVQILQILQKDPGSSAEPSGSTEPSDSDPGSQNTPASPSEDPDPTAPTSQGSQSGGSDAEPEPTSSPSGTPTQDAATEPATPTPTAEPTPSDPEPSPPAPSG